MTLRPRGAVLGGGRGASDSSRARGRKSPCPPRSDAHASRSEAHPFPRLEERPFLRGCAGLVRSCWSRCCSRSRSRRARFRRSARVARHGCPCPRRRSRRARAGRAVRANRPARPRPRPRLRRARITPRPREGARIFDGDVPAPGSAARPPARRARACARPAAEQPPARRCGRGRGQTRCVYPRPAARGQAARRSGGCVLASPRPPRHRRRRHLGRRRRRWG
jgi:hypothetical protein